MQLWICLFIFLCETATSGFVPTSTPLLNTLVSVIISFFKYYFIQYIFYLVTSVDLSMYFLYFTECVVFILLLYWFYSRLFISALCSTGKKSFYRKYDLNDNYCIGEANIQTRYVQSLSSGPNAAGVQISNCLCAPFIKIMKKTLCIIFRLWFANLHF